jgi:hypothetical protein
MKIQVYFTPVFEKKFKRYKKKYLSIESDLKLLIDSFPEAIAVDLGGIQAIC